MIKVGYFGSFNYDKELVIEDVGNCAIEAVDIFDQFYYFVTKTELGMVSVFTYGPINPCSDELPNCIQATYNRKKFNRQQLIMELSKFLGKKPSVLPKKPNYVSDAWEVDPEEVYKKCPNIVDIIKNWTYNKDAKIFDDMTEECDGL